MILNGLEKLIGILMMNLPKNFTHALKFVLISEGGLNTDPVDRGGLTKFGISKRAYSELDIASLTMEDAKRIYYFDYWVKQNCEEFGEKLAGFIFDSSVNCGTSRVGKWLQEIINTKLAMLKVDGVIGQKTIMAAKALSEEELLLGMIGKRVKHYSDIIRTHPDQMRMIAGWNNRVGDLLFYLIKD
jgi:lysozyme family protein